MSLEYDVREIARSVVQQQVDVLAVEDALIAFGRMADHGLPLDLTDEQYAAALQLYREIMQDLKIRTY